MNGLANLGGAGSGHRVLIGTNIQALGLPIEITEFKQLADFIFGVRYQFFVVKYQHVLWHLRLELLHQLLEAVVILDSAFKAVGVIIVALVGAEPLAIVADNGVLAITIQTDNFGFGQCFVDKACIKRILVAFCPQSVGFCQ